LSVTVASFRKDYPQEFGDLSRYPNSAVSYWLAIAQLMLNPMFWGASSATADSPPTAVIDFGIELFVAHNLVLEKEAVDAASRGGNPGTQIGVASSKSVGGVSVSYDVGQVTNPDGGFWNMTVYGLRFLRLARQRAMGPIQIGVGFPPLPFMAWGGGPWPWDWTSGPAWAGPFPGIAPSDTGFG
jgi:hypothetical protein